MYDCMQIREMATPTEVDGRHRPRPLSPELDQGQVNGIFQVQKVQNPSMKGSLGRTFQTDAPVGMYANKEKPCG